MVDAADGYKVQLDVFEGPLDLLLHLVKKHELDIIDIPISFVTEKYLEYLDLMEALSLDVAGEYLLMAATLAHIKSRMLLPGGGADDDEPGEGGEGEDGEDGEEEELDPRADLIRRLLEYQKYKEAAGKLGERPVVGRNVWTRGTPQEDALAEGIDADAIAPLADFPVLKLIEALDRLMKRAKIKIAHNVIIDRLSVSERINQIADRLEREASFSFTSLFAFASGEVAVTADEMRHEAVVTFLALLEMTKLRLIGLSQPEGEDEIYIARAASDLKDRVAQTMPKTDEYR
jgi:segregation and condensation protein A